VVVVELLIAGLHDPVMPLIEVVGNGDKLPPSQIADIGVNLGIISEPVTSHEQVFVLKVAV
jgi:hypothetical protein